MGISVAMAVFDHLHFVVPIEKNMLYGNKKIQVLRNVCMYIGII